MEKVKKEKTIPPQTPVKLTVHQVLTPTQSQRKLQLYNKHNSSQIMIIKLWIHRDQNSLSQLNKSKSQLEKKKRKKKKLLLHQILVQEKQEARKSKLKSNHSLKKKLKSLQFKENLELCKITKNKKLKNKSQSIKKMINIRKGKKIFLRMNKKKASKINKEKINLKKLKKQKMKLIQVSY